MATRATERHRCAACGRALPVAADQTGAASDEVAVDTRGLVSANDYVCGRCLDAAEDARAAPTYTATRYPADGHGIEGDPEVYEGESLDDARAAVARFLGIDPAELASRRWRGEPDQGDIEAYHESDRELCGGVAIRRVD